MFGSLPQCPRIQPSGTGVHHTCKAGRGLGIRILHMQLPYEVHQRADDKHCRGCRGANGHLALAQET